MTDLKELRRIAAAAEADATLLGWSPQDAVDLIDRVESAERLLSEVLQHRRVAAFKAREAMDRLREVASAETACREMLGKYVALYYPRQTVDSLWP